MELHTFWIWILKTYSFWNKMKPNPEHSIWRTQIFNNINPSSYGFYCSFTLRDFFWHSFLLFYEIQTAVNFFRDIRLQQPTHSPHLAVGCYLASSLKFSSVSEKAASNSSYCYLAFFPSKLFESRISKTASAKFADYLATYHLFLLLR